LNPAHVAERIRRHWRQHGPLSTLRFLASRILRRWRCVVYEASLETPGACAHWNDGDRLQVIGPENLDKALTPELRSFLGGEEAIENLEGVRTGNRLFVVANDSGFLHCGYILFQTRQTRIIGETTGPPVIACCQTVPTAQGRGLYRNALRAELCYLRERGYRRAVIETDPKNIPSRRGIEAAGFRLCRQATSWIVLNWIVGQKLVEPSGVRWRLFSL